MILLIASRHHQITQKFRLNRHHLIRNYQKPNHMQIQLILLFTHLFKALSGAKMNKHQSFW